MPLKMIRFLRASLIMCSSLLLFKATHLYNNNRNEEQATNTLVMNRLEFVHITKTGGSAIEKVGAQHGILWGACHWSNFTKLAAKIGVSEVGFGVGCNKPDFEYYNPKHILMSPWHNPPKILKKYVNASQNPYTNAELFAVIRNPYARIVSEYYCPWAGFQAKYKKDIQRDKDPNDPVNFNLWAQNLVSKVNNATKEYKMRSKDGALTIEQIKSEYILAFNNFVNQAEYVFDGDKVVIRHLIHYEDLGKEFDLLMKKFGINATMPSKKDSGVYTDKERKLTYRDLNSETIKIINDFAQPDFEKFGYKMVEDKFDDDYSLRSMFKSEL